MADVQRRRECRDNCLAKAWAAMQPLSPSKVVRRKNNFETGREVGVGGQLLFNLIAAKLFLTFLDFSAASRAINFPFWKAS